MTREQKQLQQLDARLSALNYAEALISWDGLTLAPKQSVNGRAASMEGISGLYFETLINPETKALLDELREAGDSLSEVEKAKVEVLRGDYDKIASIPAEEYAAFQGLRAKSSQAWESAKEKNDFKSFEPFLEQVIEYQKRYVAYRNLGGHPYDTLLNDYEPGLNTVGVDSFFAELRGQIVPLLKQIAPFEPEPFQSMIYDVDKQETFSRYMMVELGFDVNRGVLAQSAHPFTQNLHRNDVRMTTHYKNDDLMSALFSTIHETGHAIYEQNISEDYGLSIIATGASMGIHESQSRMFENNFGRSLPFWQHYYPVLQEYFPGQLKSLSLERFYKAINQVQPSLIRTEADEVTYPLHILIRYEIEKMIFEGAVKAKELPELWRVKYKEYLGLTPETDTLGVLQDVHWSEGLFGYFPSYALGSAYAAQFYKAMAQEVAIEENLGIGNFRPMTEWLASKIHRFGRTKKPGDIILNATGTSFDSGHYIKYLAQKCALMI